MSGKNHKSDLAILTVLSVLAAVAILAMTVAGRLGGGRDQHDMSRSSRSRNVEGTLVAYTLFERLGYPVERTERPLLGNGLPAGGVLVVLEPLVPIDGGETVELTEWVRAGGVIVCSEDVAHLLAPAADRTRSRWTERIPARTVSVPQAARDLPLARDVAAAEFETGRTLDLRREVDDTPARMTRLFSDGDGPRIAAMALGEGRVVALSDSSFMSNGLIGQKDDAVLAANLIAYARSVARGGPVAFDEYHLGFGAHETGTDAMAATLLHTRPGWAVLCLAGAGVLYLIYRGRRFGARRPVERARRRSKLEYVQAVGLTYRAAGANALALGMLLRWFRGEAAALAGLPASADLSQVAARLAQRTGRPAERYERAVRDCEAALRAKSLSGRSFTALLNRLAHIELEIRNERGTGD